MLESGHRIANGGGHYRRPGAGSTRTAAHLTHRTLTRSRKLVSVDGPESWNTKRHAAQPNRAIATRAGKASGRMSCRPVQLFRTALSVCACRSHCRSGAVRFLVGFLDHPDHRLVSYCLRLVEFPTEPFRKNGDMNVDQVEEQHDRAPANTSKSYPCAQMARHPFGTEPSRRKKFRKSKSCPRHGFKSATNPIAT